MSFLSYSKNYVTTTGNEIQKARECLVFFGHKLCIYFTT